MDSNVDSHQLTRNRRKRNFDTAVPVAYKGDGNETDNSAENVQNIFGVKKSLGFNDIPYGQEDKEEDKQKTYRKSHERAASSKSSAGGDKVKSQRSLR